MKKILTYMLLGVFLISLVSADVIFESIAETSDLKFDKSLDIELRNATVDIMVNGNYGDLESYFYVYSNERIEKEVVVYFKAKGEDCYGGKCNDVDPALHAVEFKLNGEYVDEIFEYETKDGKFAAVNITLLPNQVNILKVRVYEISFPFNYYLDSLSTFKKADYEKITITGENLNVEFNEHYPVNKISDNEFIWEYSNIDVNDPSIKDVLVISKIEVPEPEPGFFANIWDWIKSLFD